MGTTTDGYLRIRVRAVHAPTGRRRTVWLDVADALLATYTHGQLEADARQQLALTHPHLGPAGTWTVVGHDPFTPDPTD